MSVSRSSTASEALMCVCGSGSLCWWQLLNWTAAVTKVRHEYSYVQL